MLACPKKSRAEVVDGSLIVSLPAAEKPCVWKMDMARVHSAALEIREENGVFILGVKGAKGDVTDIAPFAKKKTADAALVAITRAMMKKSGHRWVKISLILLGILVLFSLFSRGSSHNGNSTAPVSASRNIEHGKPLAADEVFGN